MAGAGRTARRPGPGRHGRTAAAVGWSLDLAGLVESPLLVGIALAATSLGLLIPVLKDAGAADRPAGQLVIGGASAGEFCAVVLCRCSSPSA
ncbi:cation:proton antiporter [Streptomyces pseudogriseolus]|uniref:cation:proton antiporter domain-containing protein n=1 Tax=Streptomyces pseudogriseolus TaxID=36817 RepID=UPI003FA2FA49